MAGRVTQQTIESVVAPNTQKARLTQEVIETLVAPSTVKARVTQQVIETVVAAIVPPTTFAATITSTSTVSVVLQAPPPVAIVMSITGQSSAAVIMNGTYLAFVVGSQITVSVKLTVEVQLKPLITATSTMSVGTILINRYFGMDVVATSSVSVFLTIDRFLFPVIEGLSLVSIHLTGGAETQYIPVTIAAQSSCSIRLSLEVHAAMAWSGESAMFVRATVPEVQLAQMSWRGDGHLSILAGFTPTGSTAEQALHVAESDGGTWTATFNTQTTGALAHNITAAALQTALESLSSIGSGNVVVTGGPGGSTPFVVRFVGSLLEIPVGLITVDSSGLTGPAGLNPHVGVISLSPGYSAADDYGTVDDIAIKVQTDYQTWQYQGIQIGLKITESDIGGDEEASWSVEMTPPYSVPRINSKVLISDLRGGFWAGQLEQPKYHIMAGYMKVDFTAHGWWTVSHDFPYSQRRVFPVNVYTGDIFKAARDELTQGKIAITTDFMTGGRTVTEQFADPEQTNLFHGTPDLYGNYFADIMDHYASLGNSDDSQLAYGVRLPLLLGYMPEDPILYVEPEATVPSYTVHLADGATVDFEMDSAEIVNRYYVPWKIPDDFYGREGLASVDHPTSAFETGRLRAQITSQVFPGVADAVAYGTMLSGIHGKYQSAGASIHIPGGVPVFTALGHVFPHWRIRPNHLFDVPDLPDPSEGVPSPDLRATHFSWDQMSDDVSITTGRLGDLKRVFRQLVNSPNQLESQPNEPTDRSIRPAPDSTLPGRPWQGNDARDFNPTLPQPAVVPAENTAVGARTVTLHFVVPADDPPMPCQVDFDCILRGVTLYPPIGQTGSARIVVGHSTFLAYGSISNLAALEISGAIPARDMTIKQQFLAGDAAYVAFPSPVVGYTHVIVALTCERSW